MIRRPAALSAALLVFATPSAATAQLPKPRLTLDLYLEMEGVEGPRLSPDGRQILFTRRWIDKVNDRWRSALWIMNADGARQRRLVEASSAIWSPDGSHITYMASGEPSGSQIFVRWMDEEPAVSQITRVTETPSNLAWSPDGNWLAFTMVMPGEPRAEMWNLDLPKPEGAKWTPAPRIVEELDYRQDRTRFTDNKYRHIFVVPGGGGTPRQLTDGHWNHGPPEWTPDGRTILFSALRVPNAEYVFRESDIYAVDVATGATRQLTSRRGPDFGPLPSPDGRSIAYAGYDWTDDPYVNPVLSVMNADGSNPRPLTRGLDRRLSSTIWSPDGEGLSAFRVRSER